MPNQSITNKLIANIRQANDISKNFFTDTNRVVCIDTSNTRIGINTKTPQWSIDISGDGSYNGVKCHNLDISGRADISYALIKDLRAPNISGDIVNISFIYVNELSGDLIDISEIIFNSISGNFIYSNNTISGNYIEFISGVILNDLSINGTLKAADFSFTNVDFESVKIATNFIADTNSTSKFKGQVDFCNNNVFFKELSGNNINTFSISCDNLEVNQQADFSSINVSSEASFNTISVSGEASFNSINTENFKFNGEELLNYVTNLNDNLNNNGIANANFNRIAGKKLFITTNTTEFNNIPPVNDINYNNIINKIDSLIVSKNLEIGNNGFLKLSKIDITQGETFYNNNTNANRNYFNGNIDNTPYDMSGILGYGVDEITNEINSLILYKNNIEPPIILKESDTKILMFENLDNNLYSFDNYKFINITDKQNGNPLDNTFFLIGSQLPLNFGYVKFPLTIDITKNIEININLSLKLNNDGSGKDVDAANYTLYILSYSYASTSELKFTTLNSIKNSILVFDNSYNYANSSLNYLGKLDITSNNPNNDISGLYFGLSFETINNLTFNVENFSGYIKLIQ